MSHLDNMFHPNEGKLLMHNFHGHEHYTTRATFFFLNLGKHKFVEHSIEIVVNIFHSSRGKAAFNSISPGGGFHPTPNFYLPMQKYAKQDAKFPIL